MAVSSKVRKQQYRARKKARRVKTQEAIDTMPPEYAADCRMWIAPPGPNDARPRINWDIGAETHALMKAHAETHGVTIDDVLREIGVQFCMKRPDIYWAIKKAKITVTNN